MPRAAGIQFGLNVPTSAEVGEDPLALAVTAEALGFDFVSSSDHPAGSEPTYETWTMLCWLAAVTSRVRVVTRVLGVPYRYPAMVAKMAETFDRLSSGRLILGLGGGSADAEHHAFGMGARTPKDKTDGLEEAVKIIRGLWSEPSFTFDGRLFQTYAAQLEPKPRGRIPIWLGTFAPRALSVTGRLADGWIPSLGYAPANQALVMRERVLQAARDAGRDPGEITCAYNIDVRLTRRVVDDPSIVAGPAPFVIERLNEFVDLGFTAFNFMLDGPEMQEQAERLALEVLPVLRQRERG
jgi:alkanesulfonate monooxygenase SsuD/methylene tetrahydromethanopterin reductase-like flavin-dependent oxidoreductase (luciferase family)